MDVCTVIAKNYIAHARVLARSFAEHHPDGRFHVLVIDDHEGYIDARAEPFELVTPAELDIDGFERMAVLYDVLELSTAVKPWLLRWLLGRSPDDMAVYLDPDMRLYAPLDELLAQVHDHKLVLSPHALDPMPRDGKRPNEQDILIAGAYNLGFIGIGSGEFADQLLHWWGERLETDCIVDPSRGFFVDQRWIDLVPSMAESFHLHRDRGFNVAYWNLASRPISRAADGSWRAGDALLRLFHFSGFDPAEPHLLSKHQDRIRLGDHPALARLCAEYADELLAAGAEKVSAWPYTYAMTASGIPLNAVVRKVFRELAAGDADPESVFEPAGEAEFVEHLNAPAAESEGGTHGVTRYLAALHREREDLRRAYPDLGGADAEGYLGWARVYATEEVVPALAPRTETSTDAPAPAPVDEASRARALGVNVAGYLNSELGVGEVARQAIAALDHQGVPVLPIGVTASHSRQGHAFSHEKASAQGHPVNLVCVNADMLPAFAAGVGPRFFDGRYTIGWWWWEIADFPERWRDSFDHVDELWAGSRFVAQALSAVSPVPVVHVPVPVGVRGAPRPARERLGLPGDAFVFLFTFDFNSVLARKNPLGCLDAFVRAFPEPGEVVLVLKSINAEHHLHEQDRLRVAAQAHPHVVLVDDYLEPADKDRLTASCDCYVSLHRSEGFGITMAEAMFLGKPVIATGYSGNLDFMTADNAFLVEHALVPVGPGADPYPAGSQWAEPDVEHAAALMRRVIEEPDEARRRAQRGAADIRRTHSVAAAGERMARRLDVVATRLPPPGPPAEARAALQRAEHAGELLRSGSRPGGDRRGGRARLLPRKLAMRLMRPHTVHQKRIDQDVVDALQALARDIHTLDQRDRERDELAGSTVALRGLRDLEERPRALLEPEIAAGADRIDDLTRQVDALRAELAGHERLLRGVGLTSATEAAAGAPYPAAPQEPWSEEYNEVHATFVGRALDDPELVAAIREKRPLPSGYGEGFDERVVEFPWVAGRDLHGVVVDAGSTLNHLHVLCRLRPRMRDLHIITLAPEEEAFPRLGVSYLYADLRELPIRDSVYDRVLSLSTLEHVGLDLSHFGADGARAEDPQITALAAADELRRIARPGAEVLLTVPVGRPERFEWVRALSLEELDALIERFAPTAVDVTYFRHDGGWTLADRESVGDSRYRDHLTSGPPHERVVAAEAVACVALTVA